MITAGFFSAVSNEGSVISKEKITDGYFGLCSKACRVEEFPIRTCSYQDAFFSKLESMIQKN